MEEREDEDYVRRAVQLAEGVRAESQTTPTSHTHSPTDGKKDLRVERSRSWRRETDKKLAVLAGKMGGVLVAGGGGWRGRRGVVLWAHCLLGNCHRMLVAMAPVLLEVLLSLSHDDYGSVSIPARLSLVLAAPPLCVRVYFPPPHRNCSLHNMQEKVWKLPLSFLATLTDDAAVKLLKFIPH